VAAGLVGDSPCLVLRRRAMRVGLIVEGWTDYTFLEILIKSR